MIIFHVLYPKSTSGKTIPEATLSSESQRLNRFLLRLLTTNLSKTLPSCPDVITQTADDIFPRETCDSYVKLLARIARVYCLDPDEHACSLALTIVFVSGDTLRHTPELTLTMQWRGRGKV